MENNDRSDLAWRLNKFQTKEFFFFFFTKWLLCKREMVTGPKETHLASADPEISFIFTSFFRVPPAPTGSL